MSISAHAATPAPFHLLINGKLVAGASSFDVINPATETVFAPPFHPYTELLLSSVPEMRSDWLDEVLQRRSTA